MYRKTLKPRADDRASAKDLKKCLTGDKWMKVEMSKVGSTRRVRGPAAAS